MARNKAYGDNARKGQVREVSSPKSKNRSMDKKGYQLLESSRMVKKMARHLKELERRKSNQ